MFILNCFPKQRTRVLSVDETTNSKLQDQENGKNKNNSIDHKQISSDIDHKIKQEKVGNQKTIHLLMLGPGGSGKTTAVKQIVKLNQQQEEKDEKQLFNPIQCLEDIHKMLCYDILDLCVYNLKERNNRKEFEIEDEKCRRMIDAIAKDHSIFFGKTIIRKAMAERIAKIWACSGIKHTFASRRNQHVMDNTPYFLDKILELYVNGDDEESTTIHPRDIRYTPSWEDYVRIRDQTTGVLTYNVKARAQNKEWTFRLTDVGGQRSERKKWMNVFHPVGVVLYVTALSGYDQTIYEAIDVNAYDESFDVFRQVIQNQSFENTDFIVFLNKLDLFEEKIKKIPFTVYDKSFPSEFKHDKQKVIEYVQCRFDAIWQNDCPKHWCEQRGSLYHLTCSLDTGIMRAVMEQVNIALIKRALYASALV